MLFKFPYFSTISLSKSLKLGTTLSISLLLLNACLSPEDTPAPPAPKVEVNYLLPLLADGQIIGVDPFHPQRTALLKDVKSLANIQQYRISKLWVTKDNPDQPNKAKLYYPYFVYLEGDQIKIIDLWPTHQHYDGLVTTIPLFGDIASKNCTFKLKDGENSFAGAIFYSYADPNGSGDCDNYNVFVKTNPAYDPLASYPNTNKSFRIDLINSDPNSPQLVNVADYFTFNENFFILPLLNRPNASDPILLGRMLFDVTSVPNAVMWYPGDSTTTANTLISNFSLYSFAWNSNERYSLVVMLIDNNIYVYDLTNDPTTPLGNPVHTLAVTPSNAELANFFYLDNRVDIDAVFFFSENKLFRINLLIDTSANQTFQAEELSNLGSVTNPVSLQRLNVTPNNFFVKAVTDSVSGDYDIYAIDLKNGSNVTPRFIAHVSANAKIDFYDDHYFIDDVDQRVYDGNLDYSAGSGKQALLLPANQSFAGFVEDSFTPNSPMPLHLLLTETSDGITYSLYYFSVDSGESLYLGDWSFPGTAGTPEISTQRIDDNLLLISSLSAEGVHGTAVSHNNFEDNLAVLLPDSNDVESLRKPLGKYR